jgi:hypothetical protein
MSSDIELYKYNWDRLMLDLKNVGVDDMDKLEKILLAFGERCGNRYYLLNNEIWDEYNSFFNVIDFIRDHFDLDESSVADPFIDNRKILDHMSSSCEEVYDRLR